MNTRGLGMLLALGSLIATGTYVFVYLYRWEWNRAILTATLFIAAEIALVAMVLIKRVRAIERRLGDTGQDRSRAERERTARIVHAAEPVSQVQFAWLARPDRLSVFVPVLLAGGVLLTGVAWLVERVARLTAGPSAERRILAGLDRLRLPEDGFLTPAPDRLQLLRGPLTDPRW